MSIDGLTPAAVSLAQLGEERRRQAGAEIAKRFLVALLAARPLAQSAELPLGEIARRGPQIADSLLRAIEDDRELRNLLSDSPSVACELASLSLAEDPAAVVAAAEAMRAALWSWLASVAQSDRWQADGELANRLAYVCAELSRCALEALRAQPPEDAGGRSREEVADAQAHAESFSAPEQALQGQRTEVERDRKADGAPDPGWEFPEPADRMRAEPQEPGGERPARSVSAEALAGALPEETLHGGPYAVLLIEPADIERLSTAIEPRELDLLLERIGAVLAGELRPDDRIAQEGRGRWWLVAPHTDAAGARALAERLARAVGGAISDHGAPLALVIGIATGAEQGIGAAELAQRAEEQLYSAQAAGRPVAAQRS
jgi:GGDEF domain-containing protein